MQVNAVKTIVYDPECEGKLLVVDRTGHILQMIATFVRGFVVVIVPLLVLTGIQAMLHICNNFQTSFVLELVALSCFGLKLHMMVIMKALLSFYNIDVSVIHEA